MTAKAQASVEAIAVMIVMFIVFAIVLSLTISKQAESEKIGSAMKKANACAAFANEVESIFILGNGTKSTILLDYNITVSNRTVLLGSNVCKLCCSLTKNSSATYTLRSGIEKLENIDGRIFSVGPEISSAARYSKPGHTFISDETNDVTVKDGAYVTVDKDSRVLHVVFDAPLLSDKITAFVRCRNDETIELKNESLGAVISTALCIDDVWMWVNFTANGSVFDFNTNSRDVDYDFISVIW